MNIYDRQLAISGGTLHHIGLMLQAEDAAVAARRALPEAVCAWCDAEAGVKRDARVLVSHGICDRHLKEQLALVELLEKAIAA